MDYNFKYINKNSNYSFADRRNKYFSNLLYSFYRSKWYDAIGLTGDLMIKKNCHGWESEHLLENNTVYEGLEVNNILFSDIVRAEDVKSFQKEIVRVTSRLKPQSLTNKNPKKEFNDALGNVGTEYNSMSSNTVYYGEVPISIDADLIDQISIGYLRGRESTLIVKYTVFPSDKFQVLLKEYLEMDDINTYEISNVSLKDFFRVKEGYYSGYKTTFQRPQYWVTKLFSEINYQLKFQILKGLKSGVFVNEKKLLFPSIACFSYDRDKFPAYEKSLFRAFETRFSMPYRFEDLRLTMDDCDLKENSFSQINIFISKRKPEERERGLNSVGYVTKNYSQNILPQFILINLAKLQRKTIVNFRNEIFKQIRRNRVSLFMTKTVKIKNQLTLKVINFNRVKKDIVRDQLNPLFKFYDSDIPNALRDCLNEKCTKEHSFNSELKSHMEDSINDIDKSFKDISALYQTISDDNLGRANMRLQRLLFWMAITGIVLTIYGSNTQWANSWIEYLLEKLGLSIPRVSN